VADAVTGVEGEAMLIDCDRCTARAGAVRHVRGRAAARPAQHAVAEPAIEAGPEPETVMVDMYAARAGDFDTAERAALQALAGAGLIPPLRLAKGRTADTSRSFVMTERQSLAG